MQTSNPPKAANRNRVAQPSQTSGHSGEARFRPVAIPSQAIFSGAVEVEIDHNGVRYRLRQTSQGKLILTK
ncbi:hemin uptake protein HemP [Parachitinimonas caeni]|uniref:Hemin uptake protein HemP n=1 Tax=Parachitinimonas caeni TaxID=3031301 RepID=A0ABT7E1I2_9NEIS|nr:hemin uptake protein HemP [Parachitinimonas caeni]MDK2124767.1 hemin uptake protein HemP [Parachitinimonas caeni]